MTEEEKKAIVGKKKLIVGNPIPYTVKEVWEHHNFILCSFEEVPTICNYVILKDAEQPIQKLTANPI